MLPNLATQRFARTAARPAILLIALLGFTAIEVGCRPLIAPPQKKTVEELFQEAMVAGSQYKNQVEVTPPFGVPVSPHDGRLTKLIEDELHALDAAAEPRVSEAFQDTDVREALQILASTAGTTVVVDEKASGTVTATLEDVPFDDALKTILLPLGLVHAKKNGRYLVGLPNPESTLFSELAEHFEYQPRHTPPADVVATLPKRLSTFVRIAENRNLILIDAPHDVGLDILNRCKYVDRPVPQVVLEAIVCVVSPNSGFRFGLDWNHLIQQNGTTSLNVGLSDLTLGGQISPFGVKHIAKDFAVTTAFIKLLAQEGLVGIRAAPRVMAKDGEKAKISISRETYFSIQPTTNNNANNTFLYPQQIQKIDAGIMLEITPTIRDDNVTVVIDKAEVSENLDVNGTTLNTTQSTYPVINRRTVETTVHVKDGQTIVIGGLVQKQAVDRYREFPGLSRIPLIGKAFQYVEKQEQEAEVVIFISPRIVRSPEPDAGSIGEPVPPGEAS